MKILITHELFMPDFSGGGEKLVYEMAQNLQKRGHQVKVLTTGNPKISSYENIQTIRIPLNRYLMNLALFPIIREAKWADIIQTSTYNACFPSWLAGKILHKPVVCLVMSFWGKQWLKMRGIFKGFFSMVIEGIQVKRKYAQLIFLSDFSKKFALSSGFSQHKDNMTIINPGVDIKDYQMLEKEDFVLFSGRFAKQKGVYDLIKVAQKLPEIKFVMMGWGEEEETLREIAPENVSFISYSLKDGQKFFEMYSRAPLFFLPSYGETFGFVLVEAMASGCAIVSTIPLGFKGAVVETGNVEQMAKSIDNLMSDQEQMKQFGQENQHLAQKFNWDNFTDKLIAVYEEIIRKH